MLLVILQEGWIRLPGCAGSGTGTGSGHDCDGSSLYVDAVVVDIVDLFVEFAWVTRMQGIQSVHEHCKR